jgi:hypothetical protein
LASNGMSEFGNGVLVTGTLSPARNRHFSQTEAMHTTYHSIPSLDGWAQTELLSSAN